MKKYEKPMAVRLNDNAEGVFASSGNCYTVGYAVHQIVEEGRTDYRIQINGVHNAVDGHHSGEQILTLMFDKPVEYKSSNGQCISGDGTSSIQIKYNYHNNGVDNIGLGDVVVSSYEGLAVIGVTLSCNYDCGQH